MQGMRLWPVTRAIALALVALDGLTPLPLAAAALTAPLSAIPPFTLADGRPADVTTAMAAAVSNAVANGIGDDHAPVKVQAVSSSGGVCITPAERLTRNDVRGHLFVQRGQSWMDVELLDTRANNFRGYPPLCDMLEARPTSRFAAQVAVGLDKTSVTDCA